MKKYLVIILLPIITLLLTGCISQNSILGTYKLTEVQANNVTMTAEEWKKVTSLEYTLVVEDEKNLTISMSYINSSTNKKETDKEYYTFDEKYVYGTDNKGTEEGKKYYSYTFDKGTIVLTVLEDSHNSVYTYKK